MKNKRNFKTFQLRIYQKTVNNSRSVFNVGKLFIGINAEIDKLSGDMLLVAEHLVSEEIFAIYLMGTHGRPMQRSDKWSDSSIEALRKMGILSLQGFISKIPHFPRFPKIPIFQQTQTKI
jgi:hypothetical protein